MTNYVSFSLFGDKDFYTLGAIENIKLCSDIYPTWTPVVYVDGRVPEEVIWELKHLGALVVHESKALGLNKRAWRFAATLIPDADKVIFRDADSRINTREKACVERWLASGKPLHIMRDHPFHANWIMAGMWGIDADIGRPYVSNILSAARGIDVGEDQRLLATELYCFLRKQTIIHDSFFRREKWSTAFPTAREDGQFVGERIDEYGRPELSMRDALLNHEKSRMLRIRLRAEDYRRTRTEQKLIF
jgi:hypothetical protein